MKTIIFLCFLLFNTHSSEYSEVTVRVVNDDAEEKGLIFLAGFDNENDYPEDEKATLKDSTNWVNGVEFKLQLKKGRYSFVALHDVNENRQLDKNFLGIPTEPFGFSNDPTLIWGTPGFDKTSVNITKDTTIIIEMFF